MTLDEIIEYMLSSVPEEYDISVGSFFYDLLYPVAEQIYLLQKRVSRLSENTFDAIKIGLASPDMIRSWSHRDGRGRIP